MELSVRLQIALTFFLGGVRTNPSGFGVFSETTCSKTEEIKKYFFISKKFDFENNSI